MKIEIDINPGGLLRVLLGLLFIWAGLSKIADPAQFLGQLVAYRTGLPSGLLKLIAIAMPWIELCTGLALLARHWTTEATLLVSILLGVFSLLAASAVLRGLSIHCGCFDWALLGLHPGHAVVRALDSAPGALLRNLLLLAGAIWLYRVQRRHPAAPAA